VNEFELTSAFAETRATTVPPPHGLTPQAMIAAGRRARRRRQIGATAGGGLAVLVALTIGIGVVNAAPSDPYRPPAVPGQSSPTVTPSPTPPPTPLQTPSPTPVSPEPTVAPTPGAP
jgi:hypothetical protein